MELGKHIFCLSERMAAVEVKVCIAYGEHEVWEVQVNQILWVSLEISKPKIEVMLLTMSKWTEKYGNV